MMKHDEALNKMKLQYFHNIETKPCVRFVTKVIVPYFFYFAIIKPSFWGMIFEFVKVTF